MEKHVHKYVRIKVGRNKRTLYKCALFGCVHQVRDKELMPGRLSICNRCGNEYYINKEMIRKDVAKLHCDDCTKSDRAAELKRIKELLEV